MAWQAAAGLVDITPEPGTPMGGYGSLLDAEPRTGKNTFRPLVARALVLWDSGRPHVLVSADLLGWSDTAAGEVRRRVAAAAGLAKARLLLVASHTHNGPALPGVLDPWFTYGLADTAPLEEYEERLVTAVAQLVLDLLAGPRERVALDYRVTAASFAFNREGLSYTETDVPVVVARRTGGSPLAVLFGYGCHPVCAGEQDLWDGDYPAAAAAAIEDSVPDALALFLPGPAGDQDPAGSRGFDLSQGRGAELAAAVVDAARSPGRALTRMAAARLTSVSLPLDVTMTPDNLVAVRDAYASRVRADGLGWVVRHARGMVDLIDSGQPITTALPVPMQAWRFASAAPLRLIFVGGELVSGYAVHLRARHGDTEQLWIGGYGPGSVGYLPSDEVLPPLRAGGSYAGGWDRDHPGIAGGSMCAYGPLAHFPAGAAGVEPRIIDALTALVG